MEKLCHRPITYDEQMEAGIRSELSEYLRQYVHAMPGFHTTDEPDHELSFQPLVICRALGGKHIHVRAARHHRDLGGFNACRN